MESEISQYKDDASSTKLQLDTVSRQNSILHGKISDIQSLEAKRIVETTNAAKQILSLFLGLTDSQSTTRISVYVMTPRNDTVRLVARSTKNPELEGEPQAEYPKQGAILKAWTLGSHFGPLLPDPDIDLDAYVRTSSNTYAIPMNRVRRSRMKPRRYFAWQLPGNTQQGAPCGVVSIECQHEGEEFAQLLPDVIKETEIQHAIALLAYQVQEYWRMNPARPVSELEG